MTELNCEWKIENFSASAFYTGETPRSVIIKGRGTCPQSGFSAELVVIENTDRLHVKIVEQIPDVGVFVQTATETEYFLYRSEASEVLIEGLGTLRVAEPTDP